MDDETIKLLNNADDSNEFHNRILVHVRGLIKMSRCKMSQYYPFWDLQDQVYRAEKPADREDLQQRAKAKPTKMVVPNTFAQVMTFVSFIFLMFRQNSRFFELTPTGAEDFDQKREDCELSLERDLNHNEFNTKLFQHLLDVARFGLGILETCWSIEEVSAFVKRVPPPQVVGGINVAPPDPVGGWEKFVKFEGNRIKNVSPYRFFPDTQHPIVDFQKGDFVGCEEDISITELRRLESEGYVAGVDHIQPFGNKWAEERGGASRGSAVMDLLAGTNQTRRFDSKNPTAVAVVTKVQVKIVPSKFKIGNGEDDVLDSSINWPILYDVWYANDNRVIRLERREEWHNEFSYVVAQFTPDMHRTVTMGLADLVYHLQDVISWLINSHIKSVRRNIGGRCVINTKMIETKTLDGESDIYMKPSVNVDPRTAILQLQNSDVTGNHMSDSQLLGQMMEVVTGVNGNMQGQYTEGRRSAYQSRVVTAGAAGRMKLHAHLIWESSYSRLGRIMLSNQRQSLSYESFKRLVGTIVPTDLQLQEAQMMGLQPEQLVEQLTQQRYQAFQGTPEEVICSDDFFTYDSTLSSEKGYMAQSLQELLAAIMSSNPFAAQQFAATVNPAKIFEEISQLRGGGPLARFAYTPAEKQAMVLAQQQAMAAQAVAAAPQPGQEAT